MDGEKHPERRQGFQGDRENVLRGTQWHPAPTNGALTWTTRPAAHLSLAEEARRLPHRGRAFFLTEAPLGARVFQAASGNREPLEMALEGRPDGNWIRSEQREWLSRVES